MRLAALGPPEEPMHTPFMETAAFDGFAAGSERYELGFDDYDVPLRAPSPPGVRVPREVKPSVGIPFPFQ
jgi:hypothetical protein